MVLILVLAACLPPHAPPGASVEVVPLPTTDVVIVSATATLEQALLDALEARGLTPRVGDPGAYVRTFAAARDDARLPGLPDGDELLLLVDAEPRYYGYVQGRFRWVVTARITLGPDGQRAVFDVPVFLRDPHLGEADALAAAAPAIAERAGRLVGRTIGP